MERLINRYCNKLVSSGLCNEGAPLMGGLDAELTWNQTSDKASELEQVINNLNINSILFSRPTEPYFSIMQMLAQNALENDGNIYPEDTETRTFLHDIPVIDDFDSQKIIENLKRRKSVIIKDHGIVTFGIVSPEQAFIVYSSVCFSLYVKIFVDYYLNLIQNQNDKDIKPIIEKAITQYQEFTDSLTHKPKLIEPYTSNESVLEAICETGRLTVRSRMVDSFFGNISFLYNDSIFISQTGSSLDELEGYIDICPLDNSTSTAITASSEFSAHKRVYEIKDVDCILHGHPKFSVIMSMICSDFTCKNRGKCHVKCSKKRAILDIPIVPGEVGTGPTGLCNTLPESLTGRGTIVYGHGLFTTGRSNFTEAYKNLIDIEKACFQEYQTLLKQCSFVN